MVVTSLLRSPEGLGKEHDRGSQKIMSDSKFAVGSGSMRVTWPSNL